MWRFSPVACHDVTGGRGVVMRVGVFDSGVGGLSVWREIVRQHAHFDTLFVADQAHIPYGSRSPDEILGFSRGITRYLLAHGCEAIVVACNTASAAALGPLRGEFPDIAFVGMEPAIKPAAVASRRKVVGVLGTPATLAGQLFQTTLERHAADVDVVKQPCPGLVDRIETGDLESQDLDTMLRGFLRAPLDAGADVLVLACTHYPLVRPAIERLVGPDVLVIDPAPAVARQLGRRLDERPKGAMSAARAGSPGTPKTERRHDFRTTGSAPAFELVAHRILGHPVVAEMLCWEGDALHDGQRDVAAVAVGNVKRSR